MVKTIALRQDPPFCKKTDGLFMYPLPYLKRGCLVCIAPTLKKDSNLSVPFLQKCKLRAAPDIEVSTQIFRPINFVRLAHQIGGILHSHPTPTQGGFSSSILVMTTSPITATSKVSASFSKDYFLFLTTFCGHFISQHEQAQHFLTYNLARHPQALSKKTNFRYEACFCKVAPGGRGVLCKFLGGDVTLVL